MLISLKKYNFKLIIWEREGNFKENAA